jgi:hypothetical protein
MDKLAKTPGDYPRRVQEGTRRLVHDLIEEAEKARALCAALRSEKLLVEEQLLALREELDRHKAERLRLERELTEIEVKNRQYTKEFADIEMQHSNLASLYVASYRLHETLSRPAVLDTIQEIVANLIGSEELAVFELDPARGRLRLVSGYGIERLAFRDVPIDRGVIGRAVSDGAIWVAGEEKDPDLRPEETDLTACVPLRLEGRITGAIAIFRLLPQKPRLQELDHELFDLLAVHAAMALYCTGLHARAGAGG